MFIAQQIHQFQAMTAAQVPAERVLVDGRPAPSLDCGPVLVPYADNLNIIGISATEVQSGKSSSRITRVSNP